ncbi:conserved protein of unknown function [Rhodovastum atsumiense]|uniref:Uncharacterized protein n=1 Tax=Rhodovastum atsumiense TaxID=504468 RepID=A0A5M6IYD9_9PROT|nr:hypothetical protein [Rhodovastum atsumiense]KAA5612378.1 hypothetical protein F1189_09375 [Rhodovastum atsumiense]CAH2600279.1 conserved protein of unknown function [Rhodovastum atsumiense]
MTDAPRETDLSGRSRPRTATTIRIAATAGATGPLRLPLPGLAALALGAVIVAACTPRLTAQFRYAGTIPGCAPAPAAPTQATLVRVGDGFSFAPDDGSLVISGTVSPDGGFSGQLTTAPPRRDIGQSTTKPAFVLKVSGHLDEEAAQGTFATPRCQVSFRLPRQRPSLLP